MLRLNDYIAMIKVCERIAGTQIVKFMWVGGIKVDYGLVDKSILMIGNKLHSLDSRLGLSCVWTCLLSSLLNIEGSYQLILWPVKCAHACEVVGKNVLVNWTPFAKIWVLQPKYDSVCTLNIDSMQNLLL